MTHYTNTGHTNTGPGEWLINSIKKNPEGLLLLAAGCALMLRSRSSGERVSPKISGATSSPISGMTAQATNKVQEYARQANETASEYASQASAYAASTAQSVKRKSERVMEQVQTGVSGTVGSVLERQPLAIAVTGLLAGAAVALAFPATEFERQTVGPLGEQLKDAASGVADRVSEGAKAASERFQQAVDERGLNTKGAKEVAGKMAEAFTAKMSGEKSEQNTLQDQSYASKSDKPSYP